MSTQIPPAVGHMSQHVLTHLQRHRSESQSSVCRPLVVGVQGPQGSGKTYLTWLLKETLSSPPNSLSVAVLSVDDLYLPHDGLVRLAQEYPDNKLLKGRGQPGTHDVPLGTKLLHELREINGGESESKEVVLPIFEKSLFDGEGDRLPNGVIVRPPVDVVIVEGWCVGFCPISSEELERRWEDDDAAKGLDKSVFDLRAFVRREDIMDINERLKNYVGWWAMLDVFIQITPSGSSPYSLIYKWRLQQEHNMKAQNGGKGMADEQVKAFVDRYIPGYIFFSDGITEGARDPTTGQHVSPNWKGKGLRVVVGEQREVIGVEGF